MPLERHLLNSEKSRRGEKRGKEKTQKGKANKITHPPQDVISPVFSSKIWGHDKDGVLLGKLLGNILSVGGTEGTMEGTSLGSLEGSDDGSLDGSELGSLLG